MLLYEIVLRFADHDEVRLDDRDGYEPGARVVVGRRAYVVVGTEQPESATVSTRFVLRPATE